ncbi:MAG: hypothetical protein PHV06_00905 [bacterium]|nr:hypothetical protein [bacterium]
MKRTILVSILLLFISFFVYSDEIKDNLTDEQKEEIMQYLESRDEYSDYVLQKSLKSQREENILVLDRELGFLTTFEGRSFYVERIYENFQMHIFDVKTGKKLFSIPYIAIQNYTIDDSGEFYIATLEDGTIIKIPIFINEENFDNITITDADGNPLDIQFTPIYSDFGIIGARLQLSGDVYFDYKNPIYGNSGLTIFSDLGFSDTFQEMNKEQNFVLYMDYELDLPDDDDENNGKDKTN